MLGDTGFSMGKEYIGMESAMIQIERKRSWADMFRSYQIFLDGKLVGTIHQGKSSSFEVHPGHHEIFLTIDWCSSQHLSMGLAPGEKVKVICQGRNPLFGLYNITFGANNYIKLFREPFQDLLQF
jgi:hypothetical protein